MSKNSLRSVKVRQVIEVTVANDIISSVKIENTSPNKAIKKIYYDLDGNFLAEQVCIKETLEEVFEFDDNLSDDLNNF